MLDFGPKWPELTIPTRRTSKTLHLPPDFRGVAFPSPQLDILVVRCRHSHRPTPKTLGFRPLQLRWTESGNLMPEQ
eukprot:7197095-Alexandrium_andersonii.AAC.1